MILTILEKTSNTPKFAKLNKDTLMLLLTTKLTTLNPLTLELTELPFFQFKESLLSSTDKLCLFSKMPMLTLFWELLTLTKLVFSILLEDGNLPTASKLVLETHNTIPMQFNLLWILKNPSITHLNLSVSPQLIKKMIGFSPLEISKIATFKLLIPLELTKLTLKLNMKSKKSKNLKLNKLPKFTQRPLKS